MSTLVGTRKEIMAIKSRDLDCVVSFPKATSGASKVGGGKTTYKGKQYTVSEGHRRNPRTGKYNEGGEFFTYRIEANLGSAHINWDNGKTGSARRAYSGPITVSLVPTILGGGIPTPSSDSSHLNPIGAEAVSLVDPTDPNAETGVALGEIIKDRRLPIPAIQAWKRRTEIAKAASGEYLNAVFGWLPLVNDMKNTAQSILDGNTIMENYRNASGTYVHREFSFPDTTNVSVSKVGETIPSYGINFPEMTDIKPVTKTRVSTTRRWFSGSFSYKANDVGSSFATCLGIGTQAEKLFGISLTPDIVWELTPWSWAIDWFSNAGSVISNINAFKAAGLVMPYGYIMEETSIVDTYTMPNDAVVGGFAIPPATVTQTVKRRVEANPFGFGVQWDGLSPTQLAITAALGITRLR